MDQMKSCVHEVTPSNQGAIGGVESEVQSDLGLQTRLGFQM